MKNQCDGCNAGIPVANGVHRMGRDGGYPDLMGCTAKLYAADPVLEEFEAAYVESMVEIIGNGIRKRAVENTKLLMQNGDFQDPALRLAFWAWKTSRETLVIKLPEKCEYADPQSEYAKGHRQGMRAVVDQVEASGLKVKP